MAYNLQCPLVAAYSALACNWKVRRRGRSGNAEGQETRKGSMITALSHAMLFVQLFQQLATCLCRALDVGCLL